jgi:hypothetical protein
LGDFFFQLISLGAQVFDGGFQSSSVFVVGSDGGSFGLSSGLEFSFNFFFEVLQHSSDLF